MENLKKKIVGPWVFVHIKGEGYQMIFDFYVLSREETIKLIYESNDWYVHKWHRGERTVKLTNACGVKIKWLQGEGEKDDVQHEAFLNPISYKKGKSTDTWTNIFKQIMKYETPFDLPLDDYEGLIERNEYWDDSGDEANWLTMDQKFIRLAVVILPKLSPVMPKVMMNINAREYNFVLDHIS